VFSRASRVLAKSGGAEADKSVSISAFCRAIASWMAGRKCSSWIAPKGGTPNGVFHSKSSGLAEAGCPAVTGWEFNRLVIIMVKGRTLLEAIMSLFMPGMGTAGQRMTPTRE